MVLGMIEIDAHRLHLQHNLHCERSSRRNRGCCLGPSCQTSWCSVAQYVVVSFLCLSEDEDRMMPGGFGMPSRRGRPHELPLKHQLLTWLAAIEQGSQQGKLTSRLGRLRYWPRKLVYALAPLSDCRERMIEIEEGPRARNKLCEVGLWSHDLGACATVNHSRALRGCICVTVHTEMARCSSKSVLAYVGADMTSYIVIPATPAQVRTGPLQSYCSREMM
jgi:hypothetical protein